jgi:hypothetical protein
VYDDQKASLAGIIDNPEFGQLFKSIFMRVLAMKFRDLIREKGHSIRYFRLLKSDPSSKESENAKKYVEDAWLKHLNFDFSSFRLSVEPIPKVIQKPVPRQVLSNRVVNQAPPLPGNNFGVPPGLVMMRPAGGVA